MLLGPEAPSVAPDAPAAAVTATTAPAEDDVSSAAATAGSTLSGWGSEPSTQGSGVLPVPPAGIGWPSAAEAAAARSVPGQRRSFSGPLVAGAASGTNSFGPAAPPAAPPLPSTRGPIQGSAAGPLLLAAQPSIAFTRALQASAAVALQASATAPPLPPASQLLETAAPAVAATTTAANSRGGSGDSSGSSSLPLAAGNNNGTAASNGQQREVPARAPPLASPFAAASLQQGAFETSGAQPELAAAAGAAPAAPAHDGSSCGLGVEEVQQQQLQQEEEQPRNSEGEEGSCSAKASQPLTQVTSGASHATGPWKLSTPFAADLPAFDSTEDPEEGVEEEGLDSNMIGGDTHKGIDGRKQPAGAIHGNGAAATVHTSGVPDQGAAGVVDVTASGYRPAKFVPAAQQQQPAFSSPGVAAPAPQECMPTGPSAAPDSSGSPAVPPPPFAAGGSRGLPASSPHAPDAGAALLQLPVLGPGVFGGGMPLAAPYLLYHPQQPPQIPQQQQQQQQQMLAVQEAPALPPAASAASIRGGSGGLPGASLGWPTGPTAASSQQGLVAGSGVYGAAAQGSDSQGASDAQLGCLTCHPPCLTEGQLTVLHVYVSGLDRPSAPTAGGAAPSYRLVALSGASIVGDVPGVQRGGEGVIRVSLPALRCGVLKVGLLQGDSLVFVQPLLVLPAPSASEMCLLWSRMLLDKMSSQFEAQRAQHMADEIREAEAAAAAVAAALAAGARGTSIAATQPATSAPMPVLLNMPHPWPSAGEGSEIGSGVGGVRSFSGVTTVTPPSPVFAAGYAPAASPAVSQPLDAAAGWLADSAAAQQQQQQQQQQQWQQQQQQQWQGWFVEEEGTEQQKQRQALIAAAAAALGAHLAHQPGGPVPAPAPPGHPRPRGPPPTPLAAAAAAALGAAAAPARPALAAPWSLALDVGREQLHVLSVLPVQVGEVWRLQYAPIVFDVAFLVSAQTEAAIAARSAGWRQQTQGLQDAAAAAATAAAAAVTAASVRGGGAGGISNAGWPGGPPPLGPGLFVTSAAAPAAPGALMDNAEARGLTTQLVEFFAAQGMWSCLQYITDCLYGSGASARALYQTQEQTQPQTPRTGSGAAPTAPPLATERPPAAVPRDTEGASAQPGASAPQAMQQQGEEAAVYNTHTPVPAAAAGPDGDATTAMAAVDGGGAQQGGGQGSRRASAEGSALRPASAAVSPLPSPLQPLSPAARPGARPSAAVWVPTAADLGFTPLPLLLAATGRGLAAALARTLRAALLPLVALLLFKLKALSQLTALLSRAADRGGGGGGGLVFATAAASGEGISSSPSFPAAGAAAVEGDEAGGKPLVCLVTTSDDMHQV